MVIGHVHNKAVQSRPCTKLKDTSGETLKFVVALEERMKWQASFRVQEVLLQSEEEIYTTAVRTIANTKEMYVLLWNLEFHAKVQFDVKNDGGKMEQRR